MKFQKEINGKPFSVEVNRFQGKLDVIEISVSNANSEARGTMTVGVETKEELEAGVDVMVQNLSAEAERKSLINLVIGQYLQEEEPQ